MRMISVTTWSAAILSISGAVGLSAQQIGDIDTIFDEQAKFALELNPGIEYAPGRVLVRFSDDAPADFKTHARAMVGTLASKSFSAVPGLERLDVAFSVPDAIFLLEGLPFIEFAEPDYVVRHTATPNDQYFDLQWGMHNTGQSIRGILGTPDADMDAVEAWDTITGDASMVVAIIDTGTQWSHPDLDNNIWANTDEVAGNGVDDDGNGYVDDVRGWDFYSNDNDPDDNEGHGSHTAGTVGAEGNNGIGVAGVMWDVQLMPLRFLGPAGGYTSDAIDAVNYAVANGAKVSNNSWGGGGYSSALFIAIQNAGSAGHVFVAAAGNDGVNTDSSPHYPSSYTAANIISVAATDNRDALASFSNFGADSVDVGAPGVDIASTYNGNSYVWSSGTSMACPHVAGVVAIVASLNPGWTVQEIKEHVMNTTRPVSALSGRCVTGGVVNLLDAIGSGGGGGGGGGSTEPPVTPPGLSATSNGNRTATVSWTDVYEETSYELERERRRRKGWRNHTSLGPFPADTTSIIDSSGRGTFRYRIRATNANGSSAWSSWVEVSVR